MNVLFKSLCLWYSGCSNPRWLWLWMRALLHILALWIPGCTGIHCLELLKFPPWSNSSHFLSYFTGWGKSHGMSDFKEATITYNCPQEREARTPGRQTGPPYVITRLMFTSCPLPIQVFWILPYSCLQKWIFGHIRPIRTLNRPDHRDWLRNGLKTQLDQWDSIQDLFWDIAKKQSLFQWTRKYKMQV